MTRKDLRNGATTALIAIFQLVNAAFSQSQHDIVSGNLIQFNDNGAWCWYQDERAVVDTIAGRLIVGSVANNRGVGGSSRDGDIDVVFFDLQTGLSQRVTLAKGNSNFNGSDDHNAPAFLVRPDGKYLAFYAGHNANDNSYYRIYDGTAWETQQVFNWNAQRPGGVNFATTYSNLFYLSSEGRTYNFSRGNNKSPNIMMSTDMGYTWTYDGQLDSNGNVGYVNGYLKYWSNGVDRIDFICTEYHPRDYNTSIYHGYVKDGQTFKTDGTLVDAVTFDTLNIPTPTDFTKIFAAGANINGDIMNRCWIADLQRYDDGTIAAIITARANDNTQDSDVYINPDHRFIYCRYDGSTWSYTYLGKAGPKLYSSEADYTGLGALCPNDPNTIYISTTFDPRNNTNLVVHEIFKGVTADHGATWSWMPITQNSTRDNLRPTVPAWSTNKTALLWWRGTYSTAQLFDAAVVGIIDSSSDTVRLKSYVDANLANTTLADGSPLITTGPDSNSGPADNKWHLRTGVGNSNTVLASGEVGGENAPMIKTNVTVPQAGTYDVWVNFWGSQSSTADWRIKAGLSPGAMQLFRQMACKEVEAGDHYQSLVLTSSTNNSFLYQAYLGRVLVTDSNTFDVFVDDSSVQVGTQSTLKGDVDRTWYDGVSYALVGGGGTPVMAPMLALSSTEIAFGEVHADSTKKDSVLVFNSGTDTLKVTEISSTNPSFTFSPTTMTLAPSTSDYLIITFTPEDTSTQSGFIVLTHNAKGSPDSIAVSGRVLGPDAGVNIEKVPEEYSLDQNYPNPFNPTTVISYQLPVNSAVSLKVYDALGREVRTLVNERQSAGVYSVTFDARKLSSGIYFCKLVASNYSKVNRMMLVK